MRQWVGLRILSAGWLALLVALPIGSARAFQVSDDSVENRLYIIISQRDVNFPLDSVSIQIVDAPSEISTPAPVYIPSSVPAASGRIAGLSFDVPPGTPLGVVNDLIIKVGGTVSGASVNVESIVPLEVVASAPTLQGTIGDPSGVPGLATLDTDSDGTPDLNEIAVGRDPFEADTDPPAQVPLLSPLGLLLVVGLVGATALFVARRQRRAS